MENMILSLKTIYMTLMNEDFPIYSESVINRAQRKGLNMLRFWQGQIAEEFRCLPCGKMIWKNDGKRNRYTSNLRNRSAEIKTYAEYARETGWLILIALVVIAAAALLIAALGGNRRSQTVSNNPPKNPTPTVSPVRETTEAPERETNAPAVPETEETLSVSSRTDSDGSVTESF